MKTCAYYDVTLSPHQTELKKEALTTEGNLVNNSITLIKPLNYKILKLSLKNGIAFPKMCLRTIFPLYKFHIVTRQVHNMFQNLRFLKAR